MKKSGNYIYAIASFTAALSIGFLVQKADSENRLFANGLQEGSEAPVVDPSSVQLTSAKPSLSHAIPHMPDSEEDSTAPTFSSPNLGKTLGGEALEPSPDTDNQAFNAYGIPCETEMNARATPAAMVMLELTASCYPNAVFDLEHQGLRVSGITSALGAANIVVPAMAHDAEFRASFIDGFEISTQVEVPDFETFDRVALQWQGRTNLQIHALEFGANPGQNGHVWQQFPRNSAFALGAQGGFLTSLGTRNDAEAWQAEVYSFPSGSVQEHGTVRISVETEVTAFNCGQKIQAQSVQPNSPTGVEVVDLTVAMPECDAIGDVLVLNNLLRDIKVASN